MKDNATYINDDCFVHDDEFLSLVVKVSSFDTVLHGIR
jgi:hypothetical protein